MWGGCDTWSGERVLPPLPGGLGCPDVAPLGQYFPSGHSRQVIH